MCSSKYVYILQLFLQQVSDTSLLDDSKTQIFSVLLSCAHSSWNKSLVENKSINFIPFMSFKRATRISYPALFLLCKMPIILRYDFVNTYAFYSVVIVCNKSLSFLSCMRWLTWQVKELLPKGSFVPLFFPLLERRLLQFCGIWLYLKDVHAQKKKLGKFLPEIGTGVSFIAFLALRSKKSEVQKTARNRHHLATCRMMYEK